ncbi:uncharacterized protein LOC116169963 [Photinus pyralis]|uniref:uncharacterized protein LOC116169963 n=1 Tax=Photinus pyralis TaxID=7054 RepID=UPI0012674075|nr:uncharacterized protein LOC116169963 [Photinus pyralis]
MSDSDSDLIDEIEEAWDIGCSAVIPQKSRIRYENTYNIFKQWCSERNVGVTEKVLLAYFVKRSDKLKSPGSLWAEYSMLKSTIFLYESINISTFSTLIAYLKRKNVGHRPKKAQVFTKNDMVKFLNEAPDEIFLIHKVAMILGVAGACRREELYNMKVADIEDHGALLVVKIPNSKTNIQRTFTVTSQVDDKVFYLEIYRKYIKLRPTNVVSAHLFLNYRNGKCSQQVVGKGTIGKWPSKIATYLKLEGPNDYTGHAFRRTSATFLVNKGVDVLGLKRHGGWRSSTVAEGYVEDSLQNKIEFANKILCTGSNSELECVNQNHSTSSNTISIASGSNEERIVYIGNNSTNCTFNITINK